MSTLVRKASRPIGDKIFRSLLTSSGLLVLLICLAMLISLISNSTEAFSEFGFFRFICSSEWDPTAGQEQYGALPFIVGTVVTSILALILCIPFSLPVALFIGEYFKGKRIAGVIRSLTDLLAGIPSIVYGLWGFYTLRPLIDMIDGPQGNGYGILTSVLILTVMIIPYASSLTAEFVMLTPKSLKEAAYSLGATRTEVIGSVILPNARSGIVAAYILALGRALGETMAVTMLIGNTDKIPTSLFDTGQSMASLIANQFNEAHGLKLSSLIAIALVLFLITAIINGIVKIILNKKRA